MKPRTIAVLVFTLLTWSSAFAAIRLSLKSYNPGALALVRFTVASLFLIIYGRWAGIRPPERRDWPMIVLCGFLGVTVYHLALNFGAVKVRAGASAFLVNTGHIFTALLARFLLHERLRVWGWLGMALGLCGVALLAFHEESDLSFEPRIFLIVLAAASSSVYLVLQKPYLKRYSALEFTTYVMCVGTLFMLVFSREALDGLSSAPISTTFAAVYLGIVPGALGYAGWTYIMSQMSAAAAVSFLYLIPVLATLMAWAFIGERPGLLSLIGGVLSLTGIVFVQQWGRVREHDAPVLNAESAMTPLQLEKSAPQ